MKWVWAVVLAALVRPDSAQELDIYDRPVVAQLEGRPRLCLYANRHTPADVTRVAARALSDRLEPHDYVTLLRVDLRGIPTLFEGFAISRMKRAYEASTNAERLASHPDGRLVFVADSYGQHHAAIGLERGFPEAYAVVEDAQGRELARGAFPREIVRIEAALRSLGGP